MGNKDYYRKTIIDLRTRIAKERESKKKDNEYYARLIKRSSSLSIKAMYRKAKINKATYHDKRIEDLKRRIENAKKALKRC